MSDVFVLKRSAIDLITKRAQLVMLHDIIIGAIHRIEDALMEINGTIISHEENGIEIIGTILESNKGAIMKQLAEEYDIDFLWDIEFIENEETRSYIIDFWLGASTARSDVGLSVRRVVRIVLFLSKESVENGVQSSA